MFVRMLLCVIMDPFGCDGTCAATAEAPQWRHRQRGGIRGPKKPASALALRMLCLQRKSSPICKENARRRTHLEDAHGLAVIRREVHGVARYEAKSRSVTGPLVIHRS